MTGTILSRRLTELERAATDSQGPPNIVELVLAGVEPQMDSDGKRYGPGRIVTRIELVDLQPIGAKP
jgi:hypothetical protein